MPQTLTFPTHDSLTETFECPNGYCNFCLEQDAQHIATVFCYDLPDSFSVSWLIGYFEGQLDASEAERLLVRTRELCAAHWTPRPEFKLELMERVKVTPQDPIYAEDYCPDGPTFAEMCDIAGDMLKDGWAWCRRQWRSVLGGVRPAPVTYDEQMRYRYGLLFLALVLGTLILACYTIPHLQSSSYIWEAR